LLLALLGALAIGLSLGLLGSGGSILTVPVLHYLVGQPDKLAIGGSLLVVGLAAACDLVVAADGAHFALSEVKLGLVAATISPHLVRAMGARQAARYMLTAERFTATQARSLGLVQRVRDDVGPYLAEQFRGLAEHPLVGDAETCGLMGAVLLVKDKVHGAPFPGEVAIGMVCRGHCFANGLIMRAVGDRMIIAPPLVITRAQINEMVALIRRCLDLTLDDARRNGWL